MKPSTDLYDLIHSLSRNEKGYFVKFAQSQGEKSDYLHLFHALCGLTSYDRDLLKEKNKEATFLKHLAFNQNYLYRMILKSLRLYYEKQQVEIRLYALLSEVSVLEAKGLEKQAAKLLKQAKNKAKTHYHYPLLLEILKKQAIQLVATRTSNLLEETQKIYEEIFELLKVVEEEYTYRHLNHRLLLCYRRGAWAAPDQFSDLLQSLSNHPSMKDDRQLSSFYSQYMRYSIRSIEAQIYGDRLIAHINYQEILKIWEAHPAIIKANPHIYKNHIGNFLGNAIVIKKVETFEEYIDKMEKLEVRNLKEKIESFQNIVYLHLLFYLNQCHFEKAKTYIKEVEAKLLQWADKLNHSRAMTIYYNILTLFFLAEDFEEARNWLNLILNEQNREIRSDVIFFARIMACIVHFELSSELSHHYYETTYRALLKKGHKQDYEKTILTHFKYLTNSTLGKKRKEAYRDFVKALTPFKQLEPKPISIDELLIWLQARIKNRSLKEVYLEMFG